MELRVGIEAAQGGGVRRAEFMLPLDLALGPMKEVYAIPCTWYEVAESGHAEDYEKVYERAVKMLTEARAQAAGISLASSLPSNPGRAPKR